MKNQYKILAEKYEQVLEAGQGPVMTSYDGGRIKEWRLNGKLHRLDGPAVKIVGRDGREEWWQNGKLHRLDGPAFVDKDSGQQEWHQNGKLHRLDGPAVVRPAVVHANGTKEWFINGKEYSEKEFNKEIWNRNPARQNILKKASDETGIEMDI